MSILNYLKITLIPFVCLLTACNGVFNTIIFSLVPHPQHPKERLYTIKEVTFTNPIDGTQLAGELTYPASGDVFPAVVLVSGHASGSPPAGRNSEITGHKYFLVISDLLTKRGYAVLRFDNRGVGKSSGEYITATDDDFASDAAAALQWLRHSSGLNLSMSGFVGHSQGGIKSLMAASLEKPDYIVALAGLGVETVAELVIRQNMDINYAKGVDAVVTDKLVKEFSSIFKILRVSKNLTEVEQKIRQFAIESGITNEKKIQKLLDHFATHWWFKEAHKDPKPLLQGYDGPVLGLFGSKDLLVSASFNESPVRELLTHSQSEVLTFDGLNHLFQVAKNGIGPEEYWEIETTIEEIVIDKIDIWLKILVE